MQFVCVRVSDAILMYESLWLGERKIFVDELIKNLSLGLRVSGFFILIV